MTEQDEQNEALPQEMVETTDLPQDAELRTAYENMQQSEAPDPGQVVVAPLAGSGTTAADANHPVVKISCHVCGQKLDLSPLEPFSHVACPACGADLIVPKWFDNYLLEEIGGVGGMATVYRALDMALDREVAIKILNPNLALQVDKSELFLNEARTAATINHYAVIPIYTCGICDNQTYIVMQYMSGGSLETVLKNSQEPLPLLHVFCWIRDVAAGLENACHHGVVHHDIKPANIMLDQEGKAKVGDFGIAQIVTGNTSEAAAATSSSWVSPHYVSPEKLLTGTEDYHGDIYSLGATFYHIATGFTPFIHNDLDELLRMRVNGDPMAPNLQRKDIPQPISDLILAMMARDPAQRPEYAQVIEVLNQYLNNPSLLKGSSGKGLKSHTAGNQKGLQRKMPPRSHASGHHSATPPPPPPKKKKSPIVILLKVISNLLSVAVVLMLVIFLMDRNGKLDKFADYMPKMLQEKKKPLEPEKRLNTTLVQCFQSGDPESVIAEGSNVLRRETNGKRVQAALQMAYAYYLLNRSANPPEEATAAIYESLILNLNAAEKIAYEDNLLLLQYLGGQIDDDALESTARFKHARDFTAKKMLADLLMRYAKEKNLNPLTRKELLSDFELELKKLMAMPSWLYGAFNDRLLYWKQAVNQENGMVTEIEPVFRPFVKGEAHWAFKEPEKLRKRFRSALEGSDPNLGSATSVAGAGAAEDDVVISRLKLDESYKKGEDLNRPQDKSPYVFLISGPHQRRYFSEITDAEMKKIEEVRLTRLNQIKAHMVASTERFGGFKQEGISWKRGKKSMTAGPGVIKFTERNVQYVPDNKEELNADDGQKEFNIRWEDLSSKQFVTYLKQIAERRAKEPAANLTDVGQLGVAKDKKERSDAFLLAAHFAYWYGDLDSVMEILQEALKSARCPELLREIERYFQN